MKKMTKTDRFNQLLNLAEVAANPELVAFIEHEKELLAKKNASNSSGERKPTAAQLETAERRNAILEWMEIGKPYMVGEINKECPAAAGFTPQRTTGLIFPLSKGEDAPLLREEIKGKTYYTRKG